MATLNIRNLPDEVHARLRIRAARAGRSMEAEARAILMAACAEDEGNQVSAAELQSFVDGLYGAHKPASAVEELLGERRRAADSE
jgi:plasmid stability protein